MHDVHDQDLDAEDGVDEHLGWCGGTTPDGEVQGPLAENCPICSRKRTRSPGYLSPIERTSRQISVAARIFILKLYRLGSNTPFSKEMAFLPPPPLLGLLMGSNKDSAGWQSKTVSVGEPSPSAFIAWHQLGLWHEVLPAGLRSGQRQCLVLGTDRRAEMLELSCAYCIIRA